MGRSLEPRGHPHDGSTSVREQYRRGGSPGSDAAGVVGAGRRSARPRAYPAASIAPSGASALGVRRMRRTDRRAVRAVLELRGIDAQLKSRGKWHGQTATTTLACGLLLQGSNMAPCQLRYKITVWPMMNRARPVDLNRLRRILSRPCGVRVRRPKAAAAMLSTPRPGFGLRGLSAASACCRSRCSDRCPCWRR